jgi:hypothetical protein
MIPSIDFAGFIRNSMVFSDCWGGAEAARSGVSVICFRLGWMETVNIRQPIWQGKTPDQAATEKRRFGL